MSCPAPFEPAIPSSGTLGISGFCSFDESCLFATSSWTLFCATFSVGCWGSSSLIAISAWGSVAVRLSSIEAVANTGAKTSLLPSCGEVIAVALNSDSSSTGVSVPVEKLIVMLAAFCLEIATLFAQRR
jgi:hypothetical protein